MAVALPALAGHYQVSPGKNRSLDQEAQANYQILQQKAAANGGVRVDVIFDLPAGLGDINTESGLLATQNAVLTEVADFQARHAGHIVGSIVHASLTPVLQAEVSTNGLAQLLADAEVSSFSEYTESKPQLREVNSRLQTAQLPDVAGPASQYMVAVIDFGVAINHAELNGRAVRGACFSTPTGQFLTGGNLPSFCPVPTPPQPSLNGPPIRGIPCSLTSTDPFINNAMANCGHGTHVAGIAVGDASLSGFVGVSGLSPSARLIAVQAGALVRTNNPDQPYRVGFNSIDVIKALDFVFEERNFGGRKLAAVNLSLGIPFNWTDIAQCRGIDDSFTTAITRLVNADISVVAAAGNHGGGDYGLAYPACLTNVVSVAATSKFDQIVADYSVYGFNNTAKATLLAPGGNAVQFPPPVCDVATVGVGAICAARANGTRELRHGTSMSASAVAGLIARLRDRFPSLNRAQVEMLLTETGVPITPNGLVSTPIPRVAPFAAYKLASVPINISASPGGCGASSVAWNLPIGMTSANFRVRYATTQAGLVGNGIFVSTANNYLISGISGPVLAQVQATDGIGAGEWSNAVVATPGPCTPNAVTAFRSDTTTPPGTFGCFFGMQWDLGVPQPSNYEVEESCTVNGFIVTTTNSVPGSQAYIRTHQGPFGASCPINKPLLYKIRACNQFGCGQFSNDISHEPAIVRCGFGP